MNDLPAWVKRELDVSQRMEILAEKLSRRAWVIAGVAAIVMTTPVVFSSHEDWTVVGVMASLLLLGLGIALKGGARRTISLARRRRDSAIALAGKRGD
jgi:hypothetical protein